MAWAFDDEEPEIWWPQHVMEFLADDHSDDCALGIGGSCDCSAESFMPLPQRIIDHIKSGGEIRAWNASFERVIWDEIMVPRYGAPPVQLEQWVCTAAEGAAMSLPRSLDQCAIVTGVDQKKDQDGYGLMMRMTRPRSIKDGKIVWWYDRDRLTRLGEYCKQDVRTERAMKKVLRRLVPREREIYLLDQKINDRGVHLDRPLVLAAKEIADEGIARANATLEQLTGGVATEVSNPTAIKTWLGQQGVPNKSIAKAAVRDLLESDLDPTVRKVIELRADAGRSSIAKLDSMLEVASFGDQLRGLLLYHAAGTGRWGGRLVQPHNFPRGEVDFGPNGELIEVFIQLILDGKYDEIDMVVHPVVLVLSLLRYMLTAREGHHLVAADYSGIEARVLNWFAGQADILALFAAGEDVYSYNAGRFPGADPYIRGVKHKQRQTGKFQELGCGFQMGAKTAVRQAKDVYGLTLTDKEAKAIVDNYRETHPMVVAFWRESENAAFEAVSNPGSVVTFGHLRNLKFTKQGGYLYLILPSKRPLVYAAPAIELVPTPWGEMKDAVTTWGMDGYTHKWDKFSMYGGLWVENIVQAAARDLMAEGMMNVEGAGFPVVLDVHDEVVGEIPEDAPEDSLATFQSLLAAAPDWAAGCPIATEGWRGKRYRK